MTTGSEIKNIYDELFDTYKKKLTYLKTYYNDTKDNEEFAKYLKAVLDNDIYNELIKHWSFYSDNGYEYTIVIIPNDGLRKIYIGFNLMDFTYIEGFVCLFLDNKQNYQRKESI